ncbi:MAG: glycerol-3-phosphate acyltransferase [Actinomycetia bacterium]|nr:glycerol-3-phosphate acyltransferase [Actinomycetes bacterium]
MTAWLLLAIPAYLLGTFPTAIVAVGRRVLDEGSGNPGASNALRLGGKKAGVIVLLVDVAKGLIPTLVGLAIDGRGLAYVLGVAAILGHCHPASRGFRGGKGVATAAGMVGGLHPLVLLALVLVVFVPLVRLTKKASIASLVTIVFSPIGVLLGPDRDGWEVACMAAVAAYLVVRHWANIVRLLEGEEHSITGG